MSIHCVQLPAGSESDSDSSEDFTPPTRHQAPKRVEIVEPENSANGNPFEVDETTEDVPAPVKDLDYVSIGLPPLSFESHPFLSPVSAVTCQIKRHRVWVKGIKGLKFSCSVAGYTVLVAKRKQKYMKKTWFISQSTNFSLDTPDLAGMVVKRRKGSSFSVLSPRERQSDSFRQALAGIRFENGRKVIIGKDLWLKPKTDNIFKAQLNDSNCYQLNPVSRQFAIDSVKNAAFASDGEEPCFIAEKQDSKTVTITAKGPLCMVQVFGLGIALFVQ